MSVLNFDSPRGPRSGKSLKLALGASAVVVIVALASTLAANININSGPVEFGQGVASTTACDDSITVTPYSTFVNAANAGTHMFTSLKISGIDSRPGKCEGKVFVIKAYGDSGQLDLFNWEANVFNPNARVASEWQETARYNSIEIWKAADKFVWISDGSDDDDVSSETSDLENTSFTLDLTSGGVAIRRNPLASAQSVKRITVETKQGDEVVPDIGDYVVDYTSGSTIFDPTPVFSVDALTSAPNGSVWNTSAGSSLTLSTDLVKSISETDQVDFGSASGIADLGNALSGMDRLTVEMWIKFNNSVGGDFLSRPFSFGKSITDITSSGYGLFFSNGSLGINTWYDDILGFPTSSINGGWHHIIWVASSGTRYTQKIYVDGVLQQLTRTINPNEDAILRSMAYSGEIGINLQWGGSSSELKVGAVNIYAGEMPQVSIAGQNMLFQSRLT